LFGRRDSNGIVLLYLSFFLPFLAVCDLALSFGEGSDGDSAKRMSRPFGVALLLAGYDELEGCQLYFSDPSGTFTRRPLVPVVKERRATWKSRIRKP
jgi:hypothetical protein